MEKKLRNPINLKGHSPNALIPATTTSIPVHNHGTRQRTASILQQQQQQQQQQKQPASNNQTTNFPSIQTKCASQTTSVHNKNLNNNNTNDNNSAKKASASPIPTMEQLAVVHAKVSSTRNKNEEAINDLRTRIPEIENIFDIHSRIGNGTFSTVLLGTLKKETNLPESQRRKFAIKHHIPTSHPDRIMKELQCMAKIGGTDNVVGINCCIRYNESVAFIMPYLAHDRFHDFFSRMDVAEVQYYMKNLLIALRHVHRFNVIHRDVKPSNFLYNRRKRQFLLVDFGLAQQVSTSQMQLAAMVGGKSTSLTVSAPTGGGVQSEGKRLREQDDGRGKKAAAGDSVAVAVTDTEEVISGTAKRIRCTGPEFQVEQGGNTTCSSVAANTGILTKSPFKMPLKQINVITNTPVGLKSTLPNAAVDSGGGGVDGVAQPTNANTNDLVTGTPTRRSGGGGGAAALAAAGIMSSRLQQKLRVQGGAEASSYCSSSTGGGVGGGSNKNVTTPDSNGRSNPADAKYNTNRNLSNTNGPKCFCYGNPQVCNICLVKKEIHASRAGTPGYRPPEVLLKYPDQTTAVDIWAAGVIFLSVLSSVYPFFKAPNDYVALAEMVTIFGDKTIRKTAFILDRLVTLSQKTKPLDLRKLCVRFRNRAKFSSPELLKKYQHPDGTCEVCKNCDQFYFNCLCLESNFVTEPLDADDVFPASAYDLLYRLLEVNPHKRITADEALKHAFFKECHNNNNINNATTTTSTTQHQQKTPVKAPTVATAAGDTRD